MIAENGVRHVGNSRMHQSVCQVCGSISLHRLGTYGKLLGTIPVPSLTAMIRSIGTFVSRSTCPLGQVISRDSILARFPQTKMNPWIIRRHIAHAALGLFDVRDPFLRLASAKSRSHGDWIFYRSTGLPALHAAPRWSPLPSFDFFSHSSITDVRLQVRS